nr:ATPase subunit 6 [Nephrurus amyae]
MIMNYFNQFAIPQLMGLPLIIPMLLIPALLLFKTPRNFANRLTIAQDLFYTLLMKQLFGPINKSGHVWALFLTTLLLFLLLNNLVGLLPYTFTPTTQLALNLGLAFPLWTMTVLKGLRTKPSASISHLLPPSTPAPLIPALILIETISLLIRPLALGVRLTANLTAGHLLLQLFSTAALMLLTTSSPLSIVTLIILILLTGLEMAVALIQAYVFTLLLTLYLEENL